MEHAEHPILQLSESPRAPCQAVAFSGAVRATTTELRVSFWLARDPDHPL